MGKEEFDHIEEKEQSSFLQRIVEKDLEEGVYSREVCTRFPPEPNGYLHIGSAYAINISYNIAKKFGGKFNLRFDDTNPLKEDKEYVEAIIEDMKWAGFDPGDRIFYGSDYFQQLYDYALQLIEKGKAYVCDLTPEEIRSYRGTLTETGKNSPYRDRSVEENLDLFNRMKAGEFNNGEKVLRAKIDMQSPNINLRDPIIYRILHEDHYRQGNQWCIYPMYDYAHPLQDAIEGVTHSMCSIEFKDHRPLYNWTLEELELTEPPKQREFGRMNLTGVVTSKRFLRELVAEGYVDGWDDPRLPTLRGMRRRGYTPESIKHFLGEIGISKDESTVDVSMLEHSVREDLRDRAPSMMAVMNPLKVVIENYPQDENEFLEVQNHPKDPSMGTRQITFSREVYIEREDFMENPVKGFKRFAPEHEVRLRGAYFIKLVKVVKDEQGEIKELRCTYDPETKSGSGFTGRKPKATIHWVDGKNCKSAEARLYEKLIEDEELLKDKTLSWDKRINTDSLKILKDIKIEKALGEAKKEEKFQFIRQGFYTVDNKHTTEEKLIFNRIVPLKDSWKKGKK
ncbi:glutamine--tRNA ligase/YqeY domain fusion protein [Isachenkonia alkalipeptolytica]|uniref:Glutamine--tRNA ligase n=1 Tax=Isachenkonia alkalipeptolytica TaxID=2565777 RepID=A0AA43XH88_9CLOT|nr:glutamine--tRNA ligase/YqeY domain fusion protein [Isachenkonia alkalipeptolytica]NBG86943.1 glutamine--tRNA ligase/YqeY domain fusion protein [Isachenkonia alkalipeptolytica]